MFLRRSLARIYKSHVHDFFFLVGTFGGLYPPPPPPPPIPKKLATLSTALNCLSIEQSAFTILVAQHFFFFYRCTFTVVAPTMLIDILNHAEFSTFDLSHLEVLITGGSPIPLELLRTIQT